MNRIRAGHHRRCRLRLLMGILLTGAAGLAGGRVFLRVPRSSGTPADALGWTQVLRRDVVLNERPARLVLWASPHSPSDTVAQAAALSEKENLQATPEGGARLAWALLPRGGRVVRLLAFKTSAHGCLVMEIEQEADAPGQRPSSHPNGSPAYPGSVPKMTVQDPANRLSLEMSESPVPPDMTYRYARKKLMEDGWAPPLPGSPLLVRDGEMGVLAVNSAGQRGGSVLTWVIGPARGTPGGP